MSDWVFKKSPVNYRHDAKNIWRPSVKRSRRDGAYGWHLQRRDSAISGGYSEILLQGATRQYLCHSATHLIHL